MEQRPDDYGLDRLFWHIRDAAIVAEAGSGRIVLWNPAAEALFGYTQDEALNLNIDALVPERLRQRHLAGRTAYAKMGQGTHVAAGDTLELPALRKTGVEVRVELTFAPLGEVNRPGRYVLAMIREASRRQEWEAQRVDRAERVIGGLASLVQQRDTEMQTLLDVLPVSVAISDDPLGRYVRINLPLAKMLGLPPNTFGLDTTRGLALPESYAIWKDGAQVAMPDQPVQVAARQGASVDGWEADIVRADGTCVSAVVYAAPVLDERSRPRGSVGVFIDITARKHAEAEREELLGLERLARAEVEALLNATAALSAQAEPEAVLRALVEQAALALDAEGAAYSVADGGSIVLRLRWQDGEWDETQPAVPIDGSILGHVWKSRQPYRTNDLRSDPHASGPEIDRVRGRSVLAVPLVGPEGEQFGLLSVLNSRRFEGFNDRDERLMRAFAGHGVVALRRAQESAARLAAQQEAARRAREIEALLALAERLNGAIEVDDVLVAIVEVAAGSLGVQDAGITTYAQGEAVRRVVWSDGAHETVALHAPLEGEAATTVVRTRAPHVTEAMAPGDLVQASSFPRVVGGPGLWVPILGPRGSVLGVLGLWRILGAAPFESDDLRLAEAVAHQAAVALERASLADQLRSALKERVQGERLRAAGQLAAGLAHDLNNILGVALGRLELLLEEPDRQTAITPTSRSSLGVVHAAILDAVESVRRLQTFARGRDSRDFSAVRLHRIAHEAAELARPRWHDDALRQGRAIQLEERLIDVPPILGSASELREAVLNLIINAVDALPAGGTVALVTEADDTEVRLIVSDTGVGIAPEVAAQVWEPFFTTKDERGSGLGLAMVHGIVERHAGTALIETAPGRGTSITLSFPMATTDVTPAIVSAVAGASRPLRVLVVDDDLPLRETFVSMLESLGHEVLAAPTAMEALSVLERIEVDLVLTDHGMPEMTGLELGRLLHDRFPSLPLVLLTGWGQSFTEEGVRAAIGGRLASKPLTLDVLKDLLAWAEEWRSHTSAAS